MRPLFVPALLSALSSVSFAQAIYSTPYIFSTLAGRAGLSGTTDGTGTTARFNRPWGIAVDGSGNVFVADAANYTIRKIMPAGVVTTIAGQPGTSGTLDGPVSIAQFGTPSPQTTSTVAGPYGLAVESTGSIYVADSFSQTIRFLTASASVNTISGAANSPGFVNGALANARFNVPWGIAIDATGTVFVADTFNHVIRRIANGVVTTIAGTAGDWGSADGIGATARFLNPTGITVDPMGRLYVSDSNNTVRRITKVTAQNDLWEVSTLAGSAGTYGSTDGIGSAARFGGAPTVSPSGGITIRSPVATPSNPVVTGFSYALADIPALAADAAGNVFVLDSSNNSIRMITSTGVVTTIAGSTSAGNTDGVGAGARFSRPMGIALDSAGNLYVADWINNTIRKGAAATAPSIQVQPADQTVGIGGSATLTVIATGNPTPTFQWKRNDATIPGATTAALLFSNAQPAQAGTYSVVVTNAVGSVLSAAANLSVVNTPTITVQPVTQNAVAGQTVTLAVSAGGAPPPTFQWFKDGVSIAGATSSTLVLPNVQLAASGDYHAVATNASGSATSTGARVAVTTSRIVNLSIRSPLSAGETLIVGFVATGGAKPLLVRAIGPTLRSFGVSGAMADPQLTLYSGAVINTTNDNWGNGLAVGQLALAAMQVGAFTLPADSLDAAVLATAVDSAMTVQASAKNNVGGIVLVELYDTTPQAAARLVNVSARAKVGTGENALIAGFVVSGNAATTLLVRAVGPTLGAFGVSGVISDPRLDLFANGATTPLASNDNWGGNVTLAAAFRAVGAFALPASESKDAVLLAVLPPGAYTAQVTGVGGLTGEVLLEIYEVP